MSIEPGKLYCISNKTLSSDENVRFNEKGLFFLPSGALYKDENLTHIMSEGIFLDVPFIVLKKHATIPCYYYVMQMPEISVFGIGDNCCRMGYFFMATRDEYYKLPSYNGGVVPWEKIIKHQLWNCEAANP